MRIILKSALTAAESTTHATFLLWILLPVHAFPISALLTRLSNSNARKGPLKGIALYVQLLNQLHGAR